MAGLSGRRIIVVLLVVALAALGVGIGIGRLTKSSTEAVNASAPTPTPTPMPTSADNSTTAPPRLALNESATAAADTPAPTPAPRPTIMLVGDSITDPKTDSKTGWPVQLQAFYNTSIDVLNRGRSGYTTNSTVEMTMPDVAKELMSIPAPLVITVWLGNNDAAIPGGNFGDKHVSVEDYKRNLVTILAQLHQLAPTSKLVLMTPSVIDNATRFKVLKSRNQVTDPLDRSNEEAGKYAAATREIAAVTSGLDVSLLDIYQYFTDKYPNLTERATVQKDGLHFSPKGHTEVTQQLVAHIQQVLPSIDTPQATPNATTAL